MGIKGIPEKGTEKKKRQPGFYNQFNIEEKSNYGDSLLPLS